MLECIEIGLGKIVTTAGKPGADCRYGCGIVGRVLLNNLIGAAKGFTGFGGIAKVASHGKLGADIGGLQVRDQLVCHTLDIADHATHAARVVGQ